MIVVEYQDGLGNALQPIEVEDAAEAMELGRKLERSGYYEIYAVYDKEIEFLD